MRSELGGGGTECLMQVVEVLPEQSIDILLMRGNRRSAGVGYGQFRGRVGQAAFSETTFFTMGMSYLSIGQVSDSL
jgi:hypothetical protein